MYRLADDDDEIWVGTELGLIRFSKVNDGGQIQDSYSLFGDLNPSPDVYDILLVGDSIWLATSAGLAVSDKSNPNDLKSPAAWQTFNFDNYPELGGDEFNRIVLFDNKIYVGTPDGFFEFDRVLDTFRLVGSETVVHDLVVENDSLTVYSDSGWFTFKDDSLVEQSLAGLPDVPNTGIRFGSQIWVSVVDGDGIFRSPAPTNFSEYIYTGMPGNNVADVTVDRLGIVTAIFTTKPAGQLINGVWELRDFNVRDGTLEVVNDSNGVAYASTYGNGMYAIESGVVTQYDTTGTTLRGNSDPNGANYIVIFDMVVSGSYLFAGCYRAYNGYPIAIADVNNIVDPAGWDSLGVADGITDAFVFVLDYHQGVLVVGTQDNGLFWCYIGNDPFNKADDSCVHFTVDNSNLLSDVIRTVEFDRNGNLWVGTNFGLSIFDRGTDRFVDYALPSGFGPEIGSIEFDSRGNVWIGSRNGLVFIDATTNEQTWYTSLNSGLVMDNIRALHFDPFSGDMYIATNLGISRILSQFGQPTTDVESVIAFPNPYVINSDDDILRFNFAENADLMIMNSAGEKVIEHKVGQNWNGRNEAGEPVASGVYFFVIRDSEGNVGRGKVLLIRNR